MNMGFKRPMSSLICGYSSRRDESAQDLQLLNIFESSFAWNL